MFYHNKPFTKLIFFVVLIQAIGLFPGCHSGSESHKTSPIITVSILPQKYFTQKIAGPHYSINVMIPPGASPALYEPSPRQISDLHNSDLYLLMGDLGFEKAWISRIAKQVKELSFVNTSEGISMIAGSEDHGDHHHGHLDPHTWMSPKNAVIISNNILHALCRQFPEDSTGFHANYQILVKEINQIGSLFTQHIDVLHATHFLIYHPALGYLARDYGMHQHVLEFEGKEPPPSHIASIMDEVQRNHITSIFVQRQFSMDNAKSLAKALKLKIVPIDPLNEDWPGEMRNILIQLTGGAS